MVLIGILFKLQLWPGATLMSIIACIAGVGLLIILFFQHLGNKHSEPEERNYSFNMLKRTGVIISISIALTLIPVKTLCSLYHPDDPEYVKLFTRAYEEEKKEYWDEFNTYRKSKDK